MAELAEAEHLPSAVKNAQFVMMIQGAWGLVGGVLLLFVLLTASDGVRPAEAAAFCFTIGIAVLIGWLAQKRFSRRRRVWAVAILLEGVMLLGGIAAVIFESELGIDAPIILGLIMPVIVLFLLLLPSVRAWFNVEGLPG
ncbi:hypothetical protein [Streptosporangium pseudovulgare]|uniref:Transmembrane protein n=1 Tax=Streptosporangium pseudovulgare TaxID=35765 RepID=A0ABQ2QWE1_9ACTN|nr:hypothetical protein [Streptosporangium pseudovulgare]GGP97587.1 hypothetical protein GCM10010140_29580 [Streptosporangium pseudovulgare]